MSISLENWIRNKLQEVEEMQDYEVATDTVRVWIDLWKERKTDYNVLKVGDFLTAKDVCLMDTGNEALIVGKNYQIIRIEGDSLFIISEGDNVEHEFDFGSLSKYFIV